MHDFGVIMPGLRLSMHLLLKKHACMDSNTSTPCMPDRYVQPVDLDGLQWGSKLLRCLCKVSCCNRGYERTLALFVIVLLLFSPASSDVDMRFADLASHTCQRVSCAMAVWMA
jgi:hypothetical protein